MTRWWQLGLGAALGAMMGVYFPAQSIAMAIVVGGLLAWASLKSDGDDVLTALAAGFLTGVLGWELANLTVELTWR